MRKYEKQVARGVEFLDQSIPDWRERLKWDELDMSSGCDCVGGQLKGFFRDFIQLLPNQVKKSKYDTATFMGFDVDVWLKGSYDYGLLRKEWLRHRPMSGKAKRSQ